jgi:hypothetical protein
MLRETQLSKGTRFLYLEIVGSQAGVFRDFG